MTALCTPGWDAGCSTTELRSYPRVEIYIHFLLHLGGGQEVPLPGREGNRSPSQGWFSPSST